MMAFLVITNNLNVLVLILNNFIWILIIFKELSSLKQHKEFVIYYLKSAIRKLLWMKSNLWLVIKFKSILLKCYGRGLIFMKV